MTQPEESPPESFLQKAESISHIVQAFAILAAGLWAFYTFVYEDRIKPASEPPITAITTALTPVGKKGSLIAIQAHSQLSNIGKVRVRLLADTFNVIGVTVQTGKSEEQRSGYIKSNLYSKEVTSQVLMKTGELLKGATANPNGSYYLDPGESVSRDFIVYVPNNNFDLIRMKSAFIITKNLTQLLPIKLVVITPKQSQVYQGQLLPLEDAPCPNEAVPCYAHNEATIEISLWR